MSAATVRVPGGLGLGQSPVLASRPRRSPWVPVGALIVLGIAAWTAIQWTRSADPVPSTSSTAARVAARPQTANPRPQSPGAQSVVVVPEAPDTPTVPAPASRVSRPSSTQFEQAVRSHTAGDLEQASTHYRAAIAEDDRNLEARNNLGLLYRSRGLSNEAMEEFRRALAIDPRYVKARNHLAVVLMDAGRLADARREIEAGLAQDPRNVDLLVNQALIEKSERRPERAMELLLRAIGDRPTHAAAHYNLALLYDERDALPLAYDHYTDFLAYAGPEYGAVIPDVRQRLQTIALAAGAPR